MTGAVEILPAALRTSVAWKNGGGVTREIAAFPRGADLSHFDWRISTAEVRSGGLFSAFPDIERILCVLEGELTLSRSGPSRLCGYRRAAHPLRLPATFPHKRSRMAGSWWI